MADAEDRPPENLSAERTRVDHRTHIGVREEIDNVVLAGFDIYFYFGEARYIGVRVAIALVIVALLGLACGAARADDFSLPGLSADSDAYAAQLATG